MTAIDRSLPGAGPNGEHIFLSGEEAIKKMTVAEGMKVSLFASEKEFPELAKPVPMPENIPRDVAGVINTTFTSTTAAVIACFPECWEPERSSSGWKSDGNERVR